MASVDRFIDSMQERVKSTSFSVLLFFFKLISGLFFSLSLALIGEQMIDYGTLSFVFVLVLFTGVFFRFTKNWQYLGVFIFNLIIVLVGFILRLYILKAPEL